eukprot:Gb_11582 [translate_table: standard]
MCGVKNKLFQYPRALEWPISNALGVSSIAFPDRHLC